jgi:hypothetical protein
LGSGCDWVLKNKKTEHPRASAEPIQKAPAHLLFFPPTRFLHKKIQNVFSYTFGKINRKINPCQNRFTKK